MSTPEATSPRIERRDLVLVFALALVARALAFPFTDNVYGDSVVRSELAERWLESPHLIRSFQDGVFQFGPLHTYWLAAFLKLWPDRVDATRFSSLVAGMLTVWPLMRTVTRSFGAEAARWAGLAFAAWSLHIQGSTTAGSEALCLTLFAFAFDGLMEGLAGRAIAPLIRSALFMNLACATRYDMWLYLPLFALAILVLSPDRTSGLIRGVVFGLCCLPFPLFWLDGNERASGDALFPIHHIDAFHAAWTKDGIKWLGEWEMRKWAAYFWPGTLVVTLSPLFGLLALLGALRSPWSRQGRLFALFAALPAAYYTFRGAVLLNFSPLARFTVVQLYLCLGFAEPTFRWATQRLPAGMQRALAGLVLVVGLATPLTLAAMSWQVDEGRGHMVKPISPVSTMPLLQKRAAEWLRTHVLGDDIAVIDADSDGAYTDIGVAFFSNLPEARMVRVRWEDFPTRIHTVKPQWVITWPTGSLPKQAAWVREGDKATLDGRAFEKVEQLDGVGGRFELFHALPTPQ